MYKTFSSHVGELLGSGRLERLESASLRHNKLLILGENSQREQLEAVANTAARFSRLPALPQSDSSFELRLGGRLMVNMSTGVLENAGLALHRHFNCPYIPGSALKGIARHAAWCEWKKMPANEKTNIDAASARIFGSPVSGTKNCENEQGTVCFMDAYPKDRDWALIPDVLTPHGGNDYSNPTPCFFLAVEKGASFRFSLRKTNRTHPEDLGQAEDWLRQGLFNHGVGAKTIAGYGWFIDENTMEKAIGVELVTPGFFGGASHQNGADTTLRTPSLRGMLRWWWRTLYRDLLPERYMLDLEKAMWGSTEGSGWIRTRIIAVSEPKTELFNFKAGFNPKPDFACQHSIDTRNHGLHYMAYGMDERNRDEVKQRYFCQPGSRWKILFSIRNNAEEVELTAGGQKLKATRQELMKQAEAALSLLCQFGGIGSKSRNGFGSLQWDGALDLHECRAVAKKFCAAHKLGGKPESMAYSWETALENSIEVPCRDAWTVLDRLGLAVKEFASEYKHRDQKAVLGLPRKIHGPMNNPLRHQNMSSHQRPENLMPELRKAQNGNKTRFAAPIWYHLEKTAGGMKLRIVAFPSEQIRKLPVSEQMLGDLVTHVVESLDKAEWNVRQQAPRPSQSGGFRQAQRPVHQPPASVGGLVANKEVRAVLLEEKTKKGGWRVCPVGTQASGPVVNTGDIPGDKKTGDEIAVIVNSLNPPMFRYKK
ncbi:type III-B CRISPR module RAMP protein Cmr6 [Pontiella sp.]|uniref:type III-B CRISPR module RAMP protein Cmr6 n=1 Tax=Pontiella sp. TaxID=2837462 RepID=UPI0035678AC3